MQAQGTGQSTIHCSKAYMVGTDEKKSSSGKYTMNSQHRCSSVHFVKSYPGISHSPGSNASMGLSDIIQWRLQFSSLELATQPVVKEYHRYKQMKVLVKQRPG